ncbi:hypothetical protein CYMTET_32185 [Cymbomonas tetramitiformis]|uniref:Uncharacterized protein n=1 Tax=Cymbomonas tetramitiformis TaxID=36881 RepID=A0AAE0FFJ4_9CHLO|nr:hypothetical protein CYMTET_32185 [Cymbomonas tetramitiformis]
MLAAVDPHASSDGYATDTGDEDVAPAQPSPGLGCGVSVGGTGEYTFTAPPVGTGLAATAAAMPTAFPPAGPSVDRGGLGELSPDAIPLWRQGRRRARQGFWLMPFGHIPNHPPSPPLSDALPSPDYSPGPTTDEESEQSANDMGSEDVSFWSTNDPPATPQPQSFHTVTLLRATRGMPPAG